MTSNEERARSKIDNPQAHGLEIERIPFNDLPVDRNDSLWTEIRATFKLSIGELSALKNARCEITDHPQQGDMKIISDCLAEISAELGRQATELGRQGKKLEFVVGEVVIQHRVRLDIWEDSKRSKVEQADFKENLINYYQCQHPSDPNLLRCMVLDDFFPRNLVIASHIWKYFTNGRGLDEFGLLKEDLSSARNGILMCRKIEEAFDTKRLCFLVDRINTNNLVLKVLDPILLSSTSPEVIPGYSPLTFRDVDGYSLKHPVKNIPFRRILDFHAKLSYKNAINRRWLAPNSTFDDFFNMSIGASIPDLNPYQVMGDEI